MYLYKDHCGICLLTTNIYTLRKNESELLQFHIGNRIRFHTCDNTQKESYYSIQDFIEKYQLKIIVVIVQVIHQE